MRTTKRTFDKPNTTMDAIEKLTLDAVELGGSKVVRVTAEPGWAWSVHSKPVQKTVSCQVDHLFYVISGRVAARTDDGQEETFAPGDLAHIPPGHDGWTVGEEPAVWIEIAH